MTTKPPRHDVDESKLKVSEPKQWAAGVTGVVVSGQRGFEQMGATRTVRTLRLLNQQEGFDCPGCAWPDPQGHRKFAEFCENGAKAVAEEATLRRVGPDFFAAHPVSELAERTDYWLGQQGRLTHPMVLRPDATHYAPISWDDALDLVSDHLRGLDSPHEAVFYTSGRTSNEAAFTYQLLVRSFGTNNLPDCSNMCHESSGAALNQTIGIGKGSVSLADFGKADLIVVVGQNPGTNHPRMLSALEEAKDAGARIVAVNPLPEAGLMRFKNPQRVNGVIGRGTPLADMFCQVRLGGDLALFQAVGHLLLAKENAAPGTVVDQDFVTGHTHGFAEYAAHVADLDWAAVDQATGLSRQEISELADLLAGSRRTIVCWAMGLTQHKHAVATIREIVNVLLLRGMIGKPGAGVCPVRGHSNVQGDRTMGIWEKMPEAFLDKLEAEFGVPMPREHGFDTVDGAARDGRRPGEGLLRGRRQLRLGDTGHGTDRGRAALVRADRAGVDETEPVARRHRRHGADPAHARPHRAGRPARRAVRHRRGLDVDGAPLPRPVWRRRASTCCPRWRSCAAWPGRCSGRSTRCRGGRSNTTTT